MLDRLILPFFEKTLEAPGASLANAGFKPEILIIAEMAFGLTAAILAGTGMYMAALAVFLISRFLDGLAFAAAKSAGLTGFGRYLDLFTALLTFAAMVLGFAFLDGGTALVAAVLIFSMLAWAGTTLAYAGVARGLKIKADSSGSAVLDFLSNLIGITELTLGVVLMLLFPDFFAAIGLILALLMVAVTFFRVLKARAVFG